MCLLMTLIFFKLLELYQELITKLDYILINILLQIKKKYSLHGLFKYRLFDIHFVINSMFT